MVENRNFAALDWVIGEIDETLKLARQSLEAYVGNPQDSTRLRFCLTHIHQVHGSLKMLEFAGAAALAEEMEALAHGMIGGEFSNERGAQEVLMRAILQLPIYLEQVKNQRQESPSHLQSLINDLRAAQGQSLVVDELPFSPDLSASHQAVGNPSSLQKDPAQYSAVMKKLRQMFQYAAAGFIKGANPEENLAYLEKAFTRLFSLTAGSPRQATWDIALAMVENVQASQVPVTDVLKTLVRQLDKEIRLLIEKTQPALKSPTREELLRDLLHYVVNSGQQSPRIDRLKATYKLVDEATDTDDEFLAGPDPETMRTVLGALNNELSGVKKVLSIENQEEREAAVHDVLPIFKRIADTLALVGIEDVRGIALKQAEALQQAIAQGQINHDTLSDLADQTLEIEQRLNMLTSATLHPELAGQDSTQAHLTQAQDNVLHEARNGLEQAKDAIIEYIASHWERVHLQNVPNVLEEVRGGLLMIPLPRPAAILQSCGQYLEEELLTKGAIPQWSALDTLADAIASVEYFLERLSSNRDDGDETLLSLAEDSVASLGYRVSDPLPRAEVEAAETQNTLTVADQSEQQDTDSSPELDPLQALAVEQTTDAETLDNLSETADHAGLTGVDVNEEPSPSQPVLNESPAAIERDDDIDEEILEIFVEEAHEVLEAIDEFFPQWASDFDNNNALTEFRRAFHTLKGSGRMVGANDIGELAWSIENMLNRIIDGTIKPHAIQAALIGRVRAVLPEFIHAFEHCAPNPNPEAALQLREWGEAISRGEMPDGLLDSEIALNQNGFDEEQNVEDDDIDDSNAVLWEIFGGEALTHLQVVQGFIHEMETAAPLFTPPSEAMQRALHTLKGSAHMADVHPIAALATPLESFCKELRTYQVNIDEDVLQLVQDGVVYIEGALEQIKDGVAEVVIPKLPQFLARVAELRDLFVGPLIRQQEENETKTVDPELLSIFMAEEMDLLLDADEIIQQWQQQPSYPERLAPLMDELSTLGKGAGRANLPPMEGLTQQLASIYAASQGSLALLSTEDFVVLQQAHEALLDMVDAVAAGQNLKLVDPALMDALHGLQNTFLQSASIAGSLDNTEGAPPLEEADIVPPFEANEPAITEGEVAPSEELQYDWHQPETTGYEPAQEITFTHDAASAADAPSDSGDSVQDSYSSDDYYQASSGSTSTEQQGSEQQGNVSTYNEPVLPSGDESLTSDNSFSALTSDAPLSSSGYEFAPVEPTLGNGAADSTDIPLKDGEPHVDDEDIDPEILDIFLEEAQELMEDIEKSVHDWSEDWADMEACEELKRALHTLKGGARLSGMVSVGNVTHDFETEVIATAETGQFTQDFFAHLHVYQDQLQKGIEAVREAMLGRGNLPDALVMSLATEPASNTTIANTDEFEGEGSWTAAPEYSGPDMGNEGASILPFTPRDNIPVVTSGDDFTLPSPAKSVTAQGSGGVSASPLQTRRSAPQEVVKVSAELLEELVNLAGETSISRGRMEEQMSELGFALEEMDTTISRLQEQLRRLDIETEAQIIFRQEQMAEMEEFDPLEMDRYSQLQQLSRSLIESASDLMDLKGTLTDKTRDTETLLLQQSRINTDLQEGLMRSRMVPFSRMVPRLRRIVRQISNELNKRVSFELDNVEGELDRTVLERMVAPMEHMLRNAVDHGLESPAERIAAGKPESGRIVLTLGREGSDVVLRLADDGRGINLEKVKAKAIDRGLMSAEASLSDQDIMQFIIHAGFSTADSVTQISGRGVGMDVVSSEIKQLGGSIAINSRWGEGTEFVVRLPFTVSVNRALMIRIGDDRYAVPLNTIEGIVRISPYELEHYYQNPDQRFEYAGVEYEVKYLGNVLNSSVAPKLEGQAMPLPVVLVQTSQNAVALQVDMLMGSREIVVKSLGPQFASVLGVSGATVTGDGSVVVILDPYAMIRRDAALAHMPSVLLQETPTTNHEDIRKTVMVVDDSVTVRKVTSRFLDREGYDVVTAKDGADAMLILQDVIPDVMLLDIEMPRMDGFEVAKNIRTTSRLKNIPIIMITSRTGEKHRERALSLGVNAYMGKPYQEDKLLENIQRLASEPTAIEGGES